MTCNCKSELEAKILEQFKKKAPDATDHRVYLKGYGLALIGNTMMLRGSMPVESIARFTLKNGGTKEKTLKQSMFYSYCPFCGANAEGGAA